MKVVVPVILSGGSGTRLWPLSRAGFPKQFLSFDGTFSLFQLAVKRLCAISMDGVRIADPVIVANEEHRFIIQDQLKAIGVERFDIIPEPAGRNTAPALTLATLRAAQGEADPLCFAVPADQQIPDQQAFQSAVHAAISATDQFSIMTLGIRPDRPETGFGYIRFVPESGDQPLHASAVSQFVEKPDQTTAEAYVQSGHYLWNSGMFILRAGKWLDALKRFRPDIAEAVVKAWDAHTQDGCFLRPDAALFRQCPSESIDYAVIEPCAAAGDSIGVVPLDAGWSDLGAWNAVWQTGNQDAQRNVCRGDVIALDTTGSLLHSTGRMLAVVGLRDMVVVETPDAVLVAPLEKSQAVKDVVSILQQQQRPEAVTQRQVHRPWGWYMSVDEDSRFKVKRIMVKPGASLSLQMHHHRAEHWIVVKGTAEITCGEQVSLFTENQSTYIPLGMKHRLRNPGTIPLEIIEVQSGSYLGEDDIVRFEDTYGRAK